MLQNQAHGISKDTNEMFIWSFSKQFSSFYQSFQIAEITFPVHSIEMRFVAQKNSRYKHVRMHKYNYPDARVHTHSPAHKFIQKSLR